jgi:hypothetical protein
MTQLLMIKCYIPTTKLPKWKEQVSCEFEVDGPSDENPGCWANPTSPSGFDQHTSSVRGLCDQCFPQWRSWVRDIRWRCRRVQVVWNAEVTKAEHHSTPFLVVQIRETPWTQSRRNPANHRISEGVKMNRGNRVTYSSSTVG